MRKMTIAPLLIGLILSSCGPATTSQATPDIDTIHTAAAQTVIAEFTQTALAIPPTEAATETQPATATTEPGAQTAAPAPEASVEIPLEASPTPITCDDADFVADVSVPDGTEMKNTGTCTWGSGYSVIYSFGEKMSGVAEPLTTAVAPNEEVEISVRFKAPQDVGQYASTWRMANANNSPFGKTFYVLIVVR